jgi:hypothetical protein
MDLKNRFRNDSSSDIDYSVKTIWNTTGKLLPSNKLFVIKSKFSEKMGSLVILFLKILKRGKIDKILYYTRFISHFVALACFMFYVL